MISSSFSTARALLADPIGALAANDSSTVDDHVAALQEADAKRDATQIVELTSRARQL